MKRPTREEWIQRKAMRKTPHAQPAEEPEETTPLPPELLKSAFVEPGYRLPLAEPGAEARQQARRLPLLKVPYVRVPIQWLLNPDRRGYFLNAEARLFLLVLYRSHWGQVGVKLTAAVAAEIGLAERTKRKAITQLERKGWIRVERQSPLEAPVVWPITLPS